MKILVTSFSQTGNTKLVAEAIYEAASGNKEIKPFEQVESRIGLSRIARIGSRE